MIRYENIYYGNKEPGELGFDPLRLGANPTSLAYYKVCHFYSLIVDDDGCVFCGEDEIRLLLFQHGLAARSLLSCCGCRLLRSRTAALP